MSAGGRKSTKVFINWSLQQAIFYLNHTTIQTKNIPWLLGIFPFSMVSDLTYSLKKQNKKSHNTRKINLFPIHNWWGSCKNKSKTQTAICSSLQINNNFFPYLCPSSGNQRGMLGRVFKKQQKKNLTWRQQETSNTIFSTVVILGGGR